MGKIFRIRGDNTLFEPFTIGGKTYGRFTLDNIGGIFGKTKRRTIKKRLKRLKKYI
jgi:hypothetical protein